MMIERIGPKRRHVFIPEGWKMVFGGPVLPGDRYFQCPDYKAIRHVDAEDIADLTADDFDCLIRRINK